jgi:hypothetical protein
MEKKSFSIPTLADEVDKLMVVAFAKYNIEKLVENILAHLGVRNNRFKKFELIFLLLLVHKLEFCHGMRQSFV